ncbi:dapper homolog 3-like [Paramormyrops kingsleyae]|uniref:Dishevelled-binding antagonist of beta-catenin 3a n=1 Tax=Paramormyrops kingsleyae TaxID=1676925 RepID=A0A3B3TCJ5_9TELE|nr:dapper homolog 3-like [Paramormyrops kingsleyae]
MQGAFSLPVTADRSRNKERIEASLAGLCKLELLKQRQECLVLGALSFGDTVPGHPARGDLQPPLSAPSGPMPGQDDLTLRRQLNSLQCAPWGLVTALEQQVGELKVDTETASADSLGDAGDSRPSSGFYEQSEGQSPLGFSDPSAFDELSPGHARAMWMASAQRPKSVGDIFAANRGGLLDYVPRGAVPRSFSVPHASLKGIAEGGEVEPWPWDPRYPAGFESETYGEDFQQVLRVERYILGLIQRYTLAPRPSRSRGGLALEARAISRQNSLCWTKIPPALERSDMPQNLGRQVQPSHSTEQGQSRGVAQALEDFLPLLRARPTPSHLNDLHQASLDFSRRALKPNRGQEVSSQRYYLPYSHQVPGEQLVKAQCIPGQARQTLASTSTHWPSVFSNSGWTLHAPKHLRPRPETSVKKCYPGEEHPPSMKQGRTACRSQSENSLLDHQSTEHKYNTVEQDQLKGSQAQPEGSQPVSTVDRCWHSTQEINQEAEPLGGHASRHGHRPYPPPTYCYSSGLLHPQQGVGYTECAACHTADGCIKPGLRDTESSTSEADSAGSSSLSSDSDEGGSLVWPQQLLPRLIPPLAPAQASEPGAFTKIKASHALKKKILRFRNGSLKVMTTV